MNSRIKLDQLTPVNRMTGEDLSETEELNGMLARAEAYLSSFDWPPPIVEKYLGVGIAGVLALFLFKFERSINEKDQWLWVVVGDLPSCYFVTDEANDPASALEVYCELMDEWIEAVLSNTSLENVFPVGVPATPQYADMLRSRVKFIRERIIPNYSD